MISDLGIFAQCFGSFLKNLINGRAGLFIVECQNFDLSREVAHLSELVEKVLLQYGIINQCPWHRKKRNNECVLSQRAGVILWFDMFMAKHQHLLFFSFFSGIIGWK